MKLGIVCPYDIDAPGGVQQLVLELAEHLRRRGDEVVVVAPGDRAQPPLSGVVRVGAAVRVRGNQSEVPLSVSPRAWKAVRTALAGVDVVHVHEPMMPVVGWSAMTVDKPKVVTFHADPPRWVPGAYRRLPGMGRRLRRSVITAVSEVAAAAIPEAWGRVEVIPNAIDTAWYRTSVARLSHKVCFLGRDDPRKGLDVLLEAWPSITSDHPEAQLVVMGASRGEVIPGVEFLGRVSGQSKAEQLGSSLVYVAPNRGGESFGIVLAEAMAAGCAVVYSDLPAFEAVVGGNGIAFPEGDPKALAAAVSRLLDSPEQATQLGREAQSAVARFDWEVVVERYRNAYRQAAGGVVA